MLIQHSGLSNLGTTKYNIIETLYIDLKNLIEEVIINHNNKKYKRIILKIGTFSFLVKFKNIIANIFLKKNASMLMYGCHLICQF